MISLSKINENEHYLKSKIYYIIRSDSANGLFARYCFFVGHVVYALNNGWFPVIDMQNYPNPYLEPELLGKENSWEYYFCQPLGIDLDEAYAASNVILSCRKDRSYPGTSIFNNIILLTEWRMLVKLGLLKIQPTMYQEIMKEYNKLFSSSDRILGVLLRGTDYVSLKLPNHPIPPPIDYAVQVIKEKKEEWQCNKIFLATEDYLIVNRFKEEFQDDCKTIERPYIKYDGKKALTYYRNDRENDRYLSGKEYLTQMVIVSKCNCFITAMCSGAVGVMMMTEGFEHIVSFNCGYYPPPVELILISYYILFIYSLQQR